MKVRVFTLRLDPSTGRFGDAEVADFFASHDALTVSEHFFTFDGTPTLALVVRYRDAPSVPVAARRDAPRSGGGPPPLTIAEPDRGLFEALRKWRNERAKRDGRPAYVLFTNAQLGAIASSRPDTRAALQNIDGVGDARVRDYADEVLALVAATPPGAETGGEGSAGEDVHP